jgi:hypothetical protein
MKTTSFNPAQLSTWADAVAYRKLINYSPVFYRLGLQIKPYWIAGDPLPGIYVPAWSPGPGGFPVPSGPGTQWYHFRFNNGFEGMNVGLVRDEFLRYPNSPLYVLQQLLIEVQQGART